MQRGGKKGLSTVVITLIIILVSLVAIGIIWIAVKNVVQKGSEDIEMGQFTIDASVEVIGINETRNNVSLIITRNPGKGDFTGVVFLFENITSKEKVEKHFVLYELEARGFELHLELLGVANLTKLSIYPLYRTSSNEFTMGAKTDEYIFTGIEKFLFRPGGGAICGNNIKEMWEACDGSDWGGVSDCTDLGYISGTLTCNPPGDSRECRFDESSCVSPTPQCSDGIDNDGNACKDYPSDTGCSSSSDTSESGGSCPSGCTPATCASLGYECGSGYLNGTCGGTLNCNTPGCGSQATCPSGTCVCNSGFADCNNDNTCECNLTSSSCSGGSCVLNPSGNVYYVAKTGCSDSYPGTLAQPWCTIQKAANILVAGETVYIRTGVYNELVDVQNSGTAGNYIVFKEYPGDNAILDGTGLGSWTGIFSVIGKRYIKLEGVEVRNNNVGWGILIEDNGVQDSSYVELNNLEVHNTGGEAVQIRGNSHYIIIDGCVVHDGNTYSGIDLYKWNSGRPSNVTVRNCLAYNYPNFAGIASEQADNLLVENNVVYSSALGIDVGSGDNNTIRGNLIYNSDTGIALSSNEDSRVYNNTVHDIVDEAIYSYYYSSNGEAHARNKWYNNIIYNVGFGIFETNQRPGYAKGVSKDHQFYNNLFYNIGLHGSYRTSFYFDGSENVSFYHNTIYMNVDYDAIQLLNNANRSKIKDNIISISGSYSPIIIDGTSSPTADIDYNLYHNRAGSTSGPGTHSIVANPLFVNPSGGNFHLQSSSPAINNGTNVGISSDLDWVSRPQGSAWDIGAYEYH